MATVVSKLKNNHARSGRSVDIEQWYGTSATNTIITMASGGGVAAQSDGFRRLVSVSVKFSGAASVTCTVTHNYVKIGGGTYDVQIGSIVFAANTDGVYQPTGDWYLADGDTITVVCPAVSGQTAAVVITLEGI